MAKKLADRLIDTINAEGEAQINIERVEDLVEIKAKADIAYNRLTPTVGGGGGSSGVKDILGGINVTVTKNNGKYTINAMGGGNYKEKTANYTVDKEDEVINCTSGTFTVTLPALSTVSDGRSYTIKNTGTGVITIDPDGSETIDGCADFDVIENESITLMAGSTEWLVI